MALKNIENFLKMPCEGMPWKPWEYNFEFECGDERYAKLSTFERYFTYKLLTDSDKSCAEKLPEAKRFIENCLTKKYKIINDPDGSGGEDSLTHRIYNMLWSWNKNPMNTFGKLEGNLNMGDFGGDTINSAHNPIKLLTGFNSWRKNLNSWNSDRLGYEQIVGKAEEYVKIYHTIGNFVLVPAYFNQQRGASLRICGGEKINDFWDLSLKYLHENGFGGIVPGDFTWYINYFFLWDYVYVKNGEYYSKQISPRDKKDIKQCEDFFTETVRLIKRRGIFMTAMLTLDPKDYKTLQEKIFNSDRAYNGFGDVISEIEKTIPLAPTAANILNEINSEVKNA